MIKSTLITLLLSSSALLSMHAFSSTIEFAECGENKRENGKEDCVWSDYIGGKQMPPWAVSYNTENGEYNSETVYICRDSGNVLGRAVKGVCYVPWYGREYAHSSNFQVLTMDPNNYEWRVETLRIDIDGNIKRPGKYLVKGSQEGSYPTYVCGVRDGHNIFRTGKLVNGHCWYGAGGREWNYHLSSGRVEVLYYTGYHAG
ncbi:DM9 repeat-containing protein [Pseudoalteromonas luteoviolacea]|uniref:Uncharacterized protein n=1 Tax=Pseudoalteromonas luteoviolacea S4054 TaxID=1129367 RepID=A0A0F6AEJ1_9GAMM|nr:DM9 repeat-containing protein [Pseudoalteromonas luteoviolacea]AOT11231.1 hypothetical protein S4054249_25750 [Pseudoalteromonas luteoviolacea]AOT15604.1 hypothetical protein S40542_22760 [Pseudoalteromonas luteoviolacea]AOT21052.1 hypothetical protein S4054_25670 [Pseudoalteromonas luteoviolacea]KKE84588.1 hypothetical protein N479_08465 [Pseudoalteromonas luteoviolacea S4054]KZN71267.1 hypothetical protein N481_18955 [Pseudoalteromonas luteoviolacea S4047-1]